jgi:hypothetical protein
MVFLSALNKLKYFIVWSWTYLWAFWFLLVSLLLLVLSCLRGSQFPLLLYSLGSICPLLPPWSSQDWRERHHGDNVSLHADSQVLCGPHRHLIADFRPHPHI